MSTISKTIAVLGVVAGLGVAALPLSSFAAASPASTSAVVNLTVASSGVGAPSCTATSCTIPGTNLTKGQNVSIKDADSKLMLGLSTAFTDNQGSSVDGNNAIKTISAAKTSLTSGAVSDTTYTSSGGWGIKFGGMTGYTAGGTLTSSYNPSSATQIGGGTFSTTGPVADATMSLDVRATYNYNPLAGSYTNTLTVTVTENT